MSPQEKSHSNALKAIFPFTLSQEGDRNPRGLLLVYSKCSLVSIVDTDESPEHHIPAPR